MPRKRHKATGHIVMFCDECGKYACYSDGKQCFCGNCVDVEVNESGTKFILKKNIENIDNGLLL